MIEGKAICLSTPVYPKMYPQSIFLDVKAFWMLEILIFWPVYGNISPVSLLFSGRVMF